MKAVLDTNILIDYLNGETKASEEIGLYDKRLISIVTWMEILAGAKQESDEKTLRSYLESFQIKPIDSNVAEKAVSIRKLLKVRLPDAIIYATAKNEGTILVTRNTRDFDPSLPDIREPYKIG